MKQKLSWFFNVHFPQKYHLQLFVISWVLISLSCVLPGMQAAQGTDSGPGATATPIITLEPTLQATFPAALLEAWPADGSVLDRQPEITFYFNQPMNRTSVEKNLTFQPPLPG